MKNSAKKLKKSLKTTGRCVNLRSRHGLTLDQAEAAVKLILKYRKARDDTLIKTVKLM
jgi:hypothetical protein